MTLPWATPEYRYLQRCQLSDAILIAMLFSGDVPMPLREAAETVLEVRGWVPDRSLLILIDPLPGDSGIRYMGIPCVA